MEAAQPLHKGSSNPHGPGKKQKPEKPVVIPLPVTEVANLQTQKPESTAVTAGSANLYSNRMNLNGTIAPVHGSKTIYDQGAEIRYGKFQESLAETGDLNHPETKKLEKSYISTLNISQIRDYHNLKNGTYLPKTMEEQAAAYQASKRTSYANTPAKPLEKRETAGKTDMILSDQPQPVNPDKIAAEDIEAAPPANAHGNPAFTELSGKISSTAKLQRQHESSQKATDAAQAASPSPSNERRSMAQASQVHTMDAQQPGVFNRDDFKALLTKKIKGIKLPENEAQADEFEKHNNIDEVNKTAVGDVKREKNAASYAIASTTAAQPNDAAQPVRAVAQMPTPNIGKAPAVPNAAKAMPVKRNPGSVERPVQEQTANIDSEMKAHGVTDNMLAKSNEPSFTGALAEKNKAKTQSTVATQQFRNKENQELSKTRDDAQAKASQHITGMHSARKGGLQNTHGEQKQTAGKDSQKRKEIADRINGIYQNSKKDVDGILNSLDKKVAEMFDAGSQKAKIAFEKHVDQGVKDYKKKRYGDAYADYGILYAAGKWLKDKLTGLPPEVNKYFDSGKKLYITVMDTHIDRIATYVTSQLNAAKTRIATGKKEVQKYVSSLSPSLRKIGKEAIAEIQTKFSVLEESVNSKKDALIEVLAKKYADNITSIDARIAELKTQNSGWVNQALNTLKTSVFAVIMEIKNTLAGLLSGVINAIQAIITDPIGFFRNLIAGVSQGFANFGANIWTHLKTGFFGWLTGAMKGVSLTMPEDVFSLQGIFSITSQVLGLTWGGIRAIGARVIGEPVMKVLETASEKGLEVVQVVRKDGAAGLWEYLKDQFADLKTTVMDAIIDIIQSQVIQAGIKWVMGLLTPVGAFIKAAMAIIDVVKFFIQRAAQIMELVKAFTDSIKAIASGNVGAVAKSIENALGRAVPVVIGFLASLLGIGGLADKVLGVIRKIRLRIENAIVKFWNFVKGKAAKLLGKLEIGKSIKNFYSKGKRKINNAGSGIYDFFMGTISFTATDGSRHKLYPESRSKPENIILASIPKPIEIQLDGEISISSEEGDHENVTKLRNAKEFYKNKVKPKIAELKLEQLREENSDRVVKGSKTDSQKRLDKLISERDENIISLKKLLEKASFSGGKKTEIKTKTTWQNNGIAGDFVEALPLTYLQGEFKGASPGSANPPGWKFAKEINKKGDGTIYIRGHMLNDGLHGPNTNWNLKPISNRMNREMDQNIENHAKREKAQKHKILYYKATIDEYHRGDRDGAGAFPKKLTVEWGHLMKDGKFDERGDRKRIQEMEFTQNQPFVNSIPVNELGDTLVVRIFGDLGLSEKFAKEVFLYLKNKKPNNKFENFEDFQDNYLETIIGMKREDADNFNRFRVLVRNRQINF